MSGYEDHEWIERGLKNLKPNMKLSQLGKKVADLLGEWQRGIYHLDHKALWRVKWDNEYCIIFSLGWKSLSTFDFDELTRLVFLAHHFCIRVDISGSRCNYMKLMFHERNRNGELCHRHPTLDEAVANFKEHVSLPEYQDPKEQPNV